MTFETFYQIEIDRAYERGRDWAHKSGSTREPLSDHDREFLENDAKALAHRFAATPFDPAISQEDKLRAEEHEKVLHELDDAQMAVTHASAGVRQREEELAGHGTESAEPQPHRWVLIGGIVLFAADFAVGIYDWVYDRIADPYLAGLVCLIPSAALGVFVVRSLYHHRSPQNRAFGLVAGIGLSLATGILRYSFAPDEWVFAAALTLLELFVVFLLDWQGKQLRADHQAWQAKHEDRTRSQQHLDVARQHHQRATAQAGELKQKRDAHIEEVTRRSLCFQKAAEIEAALVNAIFAGAHKGISENRGLQRGVPATVLATVFHK